MSLTSTDDTSSLHIPPGLETTGIPGASENLIGDPTTEELVDAGSYPRMLSQSLLPGKLCRRQSVTKVLILPTIH